MKFLIPHKFLPRFSTLLRVAFTLFLTSLLLPLSSCFTGIESTKKINLSREDKKLATPTPEELFMDKVKPSFLKDWEEGKIFIASDDKALLVIVPQEGILGTPMDSIKGHVLEFVGVQSKINAAGVLTLGLQFTDGVYIYVYDTGKEFDYAMENLRSDQIPMLIDLEMVEQARNLLVGKTFWTRTPLWYDNLGNRINGKKFVEVKIIDVTPGNLIFPLKLEILSSDNTQAFLFMNFGAADTESRAFANLFSLSDLRKHYPAIDDDTWECITQGIVKPGMTKEECRLSMGNPSDSNSGHDYSQTIDIWTYENGRVLWFEDGRLVKTRQ